MIKSLLGSINPTTATTYYYSLTQKEISYYHTTFYLCSILTIAGTFRITTLPSTVTPNIVVRVLKTSDRF